MYDFYKNPPETKEQLRDWLTSWLESTPSETPVFEWNGETFIQESGFRRAFHMHCVFKNVKSGEYVWWVYPDDHSIPLSTFPTKRFHTYDTMLEFVIDEYYRNWKLTK